jgi:hypothetical protein
LLAVLLGGEGLGRAEHHMARVVYDDVDAAAFSDNLFDGRVGRGLGLHIELDGAEVDAVARRHLSHLGDALGVAPCDVAHRGVDGVPDLCQGLGGQTAKAARSAGDEDDLLAHGVTPFIARAGRDGARSVAGSSLR